MKTSESSPVTLTLPGLMKLDGCVDLLPPELWPQPEAGSENGGGYRREVIVRASEPVTFASAPAIAMLGAWALRARRLGMTVTLDDSVKSPYAWRSGLLSALAGRIERNPGAPDRSLRAHLLDAAQIEPLLANFQRVLHGDIELSRAVSYFTSELLRNVFEHSGSPEGALVCASWYPTRQRFTAAVVDLGMTVPAHFARRQRLPPDPATALRMALEPLVTGSRDLNRNAGLGLYMTRRITNLLGGRFWLRTGAFLAHSFPADRPGARSAPDIHPTSGPWPGTAVVFTLYTDRGSGFGHELALAQRELAGGRLGRRLEVFFKRPDPQARIIGVPPDVGSLAQDKIAGERLRREQIMPALEQDDEVVQIDFAGITLTTQSFIHALLAEPLRALGREQVERRLRFVRCDKQVKEVIRIVLGYILDEPGDGG